MDTVRWLPPLTVGVILLVSLLSGPLVGAIDLRSEVPGDVPGDGSVDVAVLSVPDEGRLEPKRYLTGGHVVSLPPATVEVSNLSGNPMLVYKLQIPEMWYVAVTTYVLDGESTGRRTLTLDEPILNRTSLPRDSYQGELRVIRRIDERDTVLYRGNVTLWVER